MFRSVVFSVLLLLGACDVAPKSADSVSESASETVHKIHGQTMGTTYNISWAGGELPHQGVVKTSVDQLLADINKALSTYDPDSELSAINQLDIESSGRSWIPISASLSDVLNDALTLYERSERRFDITIGPLVNVWGFGPSPSEDKAPSDEQIQLLLSQIGSDKITLDADNQRLKLASPLYLDLSAIAKGWAVDRVAQRLEEQGITSYLVEIGGELRTRGVKPDTSGWKIAIEEPSVNLIERSGQRIIAPGNKAVATSGDYRNYFERNGVRYSHTIDPSSGKPVTHTLASVTVVHERCSMADGWATALNVAGPDAGLALAERFHLAAYFIIRTPEGFASVESTAFQQEYGTSDSDLERSQ